MSLDLGLMMSGATSVVQAQAAFRASVQLARIADKPTSVVFRRNQVDQAAQTVRVEYDDTMPSEASSDSGLGYSKRGILFGSSTLNVDTWDTFILNDQEFTIMHVNRSPIGHIQCDFEAVGS